MPSQSSLRLAMRALLVRETFGPDSAAGRAVDHLVDDLERREIDVVISSTVEDAVAIVSTDPSIQCLLLDWELGTGGDHQPAITVLDAMRAFNADVPIFLLADHSAASSIPTDAMTKADDFIWLLEDTTDFIGGRVLAALQRYRSTVLPPMFGALVEFARTYEYSWHTPGHTGGTAFLTSPVGRAFFEFFGESLFRSDLSISVGDLGSLLDHSGAIGDGERYAAGVFGSDRTYYVTNGSSTSNRVILMASVTRDQVALCDRNCHKSVEHAMTLSGAIPCYLMPTRNAYGIIGPIPPERLTPSALRVLVSDNPLVKDGIDPAPVHAVITNSTYDGLCYNVARVEELMGESVDRLHFDEAWYGYARFNPIYRQRFGMHGEPAERDRAAMPSVFATQSTHKLLAALSQASMIHVRDGRNPIDHARFNEAFMMHASTSPCYPIIASNDVSAAMMDSSGEKLTGASIREAIAFRQTVARLNAEIADQNGWFFDIWQPPTVTDTRGKTVAFHEADPEYLASEPGCWHLAPDAEWHGFGNIEPGYCMLDPIKVSVLTPGMDPDGGLRAVGIPASIVTSYLAARGIVVEKTTDFTILFLFSMGVTKGKWGTLVNALLDFRKDYDANVPLSRAIPSLVKDHPDRYGKMGLRELADLMFSAMDELKTTHTMSEAFSILPKPEMSPVAAYEELVRGRIDRITLDELAGRTLATGIVPYPPGIPLMMPGENAGPADGALIGYLKALEAYDQRFPGFGHDTHGVEVEDGLYRVMVLKK
ncbi:MULTISPECIES: Orn/Lys/Arg decarboxylase N-terminal domain-containing protein [Sphingomonas]|nr:MULTISPECIES: Orn/Lys/Arg decarboxylase N-terminal domain-containing protein [Sphingomonas]AGH48214.1 response regulator receiver domain-containing protein [Sphingomonas sp. MM-1]MDX3886148.1 Orn/Lys/Arg decarboxylase N-terminal domain-containing protein [Sphingomonas sp.]